MMRWPSFLDDLRQMEKLLVRKFAREQFLARCVPLAEDQKILQTFKATLKGLRWSAITNFSSEVSWL